MDREDALLLPEVAKLLEFTVTTDALSEATDPLALSEDCEGAAVIAERTPSDPVADLAQSVLTRARNKLLPLDSIEELLLVPQLVDRFWLASRELAHLGSNPILGFRQRVVCRVLARTELDKEIAVQVDPFLGRCSSLKALDEVDNAGAQVLVERLVE